MKRALGLYAGLVATLAVLATPVFAQPEQTPLTDQQRSALSVTCTTIQQTMQRIHANDAGIYVSRNQTHYTISDKLMARLNARVVSNRLDGGELVSAAARYDTALEAFRSSYRAYESQLASTIKMKCKTRPQEFYDALVKSRTLRAETNAAVQTLQQRLDAYEQAFDDFYDRHVYGRDQSETPEPAAGGATE